MAKKQKKPRKSGKQAASTSEGMSKDTPKEAPETAPEASKDPVPYFPTKAEIKKAFARSWASGGETPCGQGSRLDSTVEIRGLLPTLLAKYQIGILNDAGCGDFHWVSQLKHVFRMRKVDYMGYDLIDRKTKKMPFTELDFTAEDMRPCDLILCRDALVHLPNHLVLAALERFRATGAKYLLATTFPTVDNSKRPVEGVGGFCKIDLEADPFNLGEPLERIEEKKFRRFLGLWKLND